MAHPAQHLEYSLIRKTVAFMWGKNIMRCARVFLLLLWIVSGATFNYCKAETNPILALFLGYSKAVNTVALSEDGRQAVSGGQDNVLRLWDTATGLLLRTFDAETNRINAVAFSPDSQKILMASSDKLRLWAVAPGQTVKTMEGHTGEVTAVAFSSDGRQAISGSKDKTVKLWDMETGELLKTFEGHSDEVTAVAFSLHSHEALSGSKDRTLRLWDVQTGQLVKTFDGHTDALTSVSLSSDGAQALSGSKDKTVKLWDLASGQILKSFEGHSGEVLSVALASDGRRFLSGSKDKTLKLWDVKTGELIKTLEGHSDIVTSAAFSADGREALSGSWDKTLKIWEVEAGQLRSTIDLQSVRFSPNGYRNFFSGVSLSKTADPVKLDERLHEKGLKRGDAVFLRIFKGDLEVELWMRRAGRFEQLATYPICAWSGQLGPKLAEGDSQAPEGFYTIGKEQLNPNSHYHRAFNLGYPNVLDRANNRTGTNLMVHGGCGSIGCYAMTDAAIEELWLLVTAALNGGQERIPVHVFPFRMTDARLAAFAWHPWAAFWRDMKPAYDLFEESRIPPQISVCNKRYAVQREPAAGKSAPVLKFACPFK
jgi:WD40 repeat protein/murein L,D-transpeptidase YafK